MSIRLRRTAIVALVVALLCSVNFFVLCGLLESGRLDRSAVLINVVVTAAALPGLVLARHVCHGKRPYDERFLARYFAVVTGVTSVLFGLLALLWRPRQVTSRVAPGRRAFLRRAGWSVASGVGLVGGYALLVEPRWPRLLRLRLPLKDLPPELVGLKVVHLTDLHLGRYNSAAYLSSVVQRCNGLAPDLVLLTGDYVHGSPRFVPRAAALLGRLRPRLGTLAVLGNHDHWEGAQHSRRALRGAGIGLLDNDRVWIARRAIQRQACPGALCVAGVGDLWEDRVDLDAALGGVEATTPRLLLSHNPDVAETAAALRSRHRVDLMLAGHTHGGQVRLPGSGSLISPSRYGRKYDRGMVQGPRFRVFVSVGIGTTIFPVRLLVRPEIVCFELVANTPHSC